MGQLANTPLILSCGSRIERKRAVKDCTNHDKNGHDATEDGRMCRLAINCQLDWLTEQVNLLQKVLLSH